MSVRLHRHRSTSTGNKLLHRLGLLAAVAACFAVHPAGALAVTCPNGNPVVNENNCMGAGSSAYEMSNYNDNIGGFATKTSYNLGENVQLKIGRNLPGLPNTKANIDVYRIGSYGGLGGRRIAAASATNVTVNNTQACNPMDAVTGKLDCGNWAVTDTIPASAFPASGVYVAKLTATDTGIQNQILIIIRDDNRSVPSKMLYVVPTADYAAYNNWGGKSLYFDKNGGANTVTGTDRAAKVSFNRPEDNAELELNRFFGPDFDMIVWLEQQGYDVSYSDDVAVSQNPNSLKQHKIITTAGHSEYWTAEEYHGFKAARDAGVNVASFDSNTAYWKVRLEDGGRTLVCYKTVQGSGATGNGSATPNDAGPDGVVGTADDAVGADGIAGTADDHPENSTTTWRDNGAANGDPNAPAGGRVGPNEPENSLWGNMYVGDNDSNSWPLTVAPSNANGEYAGDRIWRNTGISQNTTTNIGTDLVGWEWDAVPTQAQYLAFQPSGVKRLSLTNVTNAGDSWLLDEGRLRATTPPPGQPSTVSAVKYRAPSGAWVFAAGTNQWAFGMGDDRIAQATYNIFSDMGVQPVTPDATLTLDPAGSGQPPVASFTAPTGTVNTGTPITFDASASSDSDGTIVKYEWDLDGDGTYETNTGTTKTVTKTYTTEGTIDVHLKVTDNSGNTDFTTRTITLLSNIPPTAAFTASPNPAVVGQTVNFDASGSSDADNSIVKYEWDLDGNGTYETNTGTTKTVTKSYSTAGTYNVGLRVTDNGSPAKTATTTVPVTVNSGGVSSYGDNVLRTSGLMDYWRMGETAGPTLADSKGTTPVTMTGGTFGVPGGPAFDPNTAISFNGSSDNGRASLDLSSKTAITVEFWLKWNNFSNDDALAMEFTPNFNDNIGGFLVDPDAPQFGGTFGVAIGTGGSRNNVFFTRPTAGAWHHYAFVINTAAPAATQIVPYVDGQAVTYQKADSGTGTTFANSTLYLMSRAGTALFGAGSMDELALYSRGLTASEISNHFGSYGTNRRPTASFTMSPSPARLNQTVTFNGSSSSDPDGSIVKYEWDLDGNGSYETTTTSPTVTKSYATEQSVTVGLRVTDNSFGTDSTTNTLFVGNAPPNASFTATPNPAITDQTVSFNASTSSDPDGSVVKYEWDLDGNGTYETTTTSPTTSKSYSTTGTVNVGLRVTDNEGKTATKVVPVTINSMGVSSYAATVLQTANLLHYFRMGEAAGPTLANSKGVATGTVTGGTFGVAGAISDDPNTAVRFNGTSDYGKVPMDLSNRATITVEFWLKWNAYANDDKLAMEFSPNFNETAGGFLVDPNANQGSFGVAMGVGSSRNNVFFARPSAGAWHHYAFVFDSTAPGATAITPYVDGQAVSYTKADSGTGAGNFANSTLNVMSRNGTALFGAGTMDELAVYGSALSAQTISEHFGAHGTNNPPTAAFTSSPSSPSTGQTVTFNASTSSDPDGPIADYQWDLDGNGSYETDTGTTPSATKSYATAGSVDVKLRVIDAQNASDTVTHTITVGDGAPTASFTATPSMPTLGQTVAFDASASSDPDGSIVDYAWDLDGNGTYETDTGTTKTTSKAYATAGAVTVGLKVTDNAGKSTTTTRTVTVKSATYSSTVLGTAGLIDYWRLGEATGTTFADSKGTSPATLTGATLGVTGALAGDADTAARFNGTSNYAQAALNLSASQTLTVEFWLKWNTNGADDDLAMEFTPNFNNSSGGFLVDPNAGGLFGIGIGVGGSRNNVFFAQPSAGVWHHYAIVLDATAPAATQIVPYVDGQAVSYSKGASGTGAGPFANSTLYFMSRAGAALFGGGDLDEVAIYNQALSAATIASHYAAGTP
jgi:YD repeat-containing protein